MKKIIPAIAALSVVAATAALAQTTTAPAPMPPAAGRAATTMSATEAAAWVKKPVYSSDNKNLGEVTAVDRDPSGNVTGLQADIGGFLGLGSTRVRINATDFTLAADRVTLNLTSAQAKDLPHVPQ